MIYLDYTATTPVSEDVKNEIINYLNIDFGNPSSPHKLGTHAAFCIEQARKTLLQSLNIQDSHNCIFTSGGSEGNSMVLSGIMKGKAGKKLIISDIEHTSVKKLATELLIEGVDVTMVKPDHLGVISVDKVLDLVDESTRLISIMAVNNETGFIFDVETICREVKKKNPNTLVHADCVQSYMKIPVNLTNIDFITVSAHKIFGSKGTGALFLKKNQSLPSLISGSHEYGIRGGTQNVAGIMGMKKAVEMLSDNINTHLEKTRELRKLFLNTLKSQLKDFDIIEGTNQSPYILGLIVKGIKSEVVVRMLSDKNVYVSAGSACSSKAKTKSTTSSSLGFNGDEYLRISMSPLLKEEQIIKAAEIITNTCNEFRIMMGE